MKKFQNLSKKEKVISITFIIVTTLSIITLLISYNVSNIQKIQQGYVNEVRDQFKTIAKYDKYNFSKEVFEINKKYPVAVEMSENGKVIFSTLDFYIEDINKDDLLMLAKDTISVGDNREIWIGIYDSINYSETFNQLFIMTLSYILVYGLMMTALLYLWSSDRKKLLANISEEKEVTRKSLYDEEIRNNEEIEEVVLREPFISDSFTSNHNEEIYPEFKDEGFEAYKTTEKTNIAEVARDGMVKEIIEEPISKGVDEEVHKQATDNNYSNFTNKYEYLRRK